MLRLLFFQLKRRHVFWTTHQQIFKSIKHLEVRLVNIQFQWKRREVWAPTFLEVTLNLNLSLIWIELVPFMGKNSIMVAICLMISKIKALESKIKQNLFWRNYRPLPIFWQLDLALNKKQNYKKLKVRLI